MMPPEPPKVSALERLRSVDAERVVPRLMTASLAASIVALVAACLMLLPGGEAGGGPVAESTPPTTRAGSPTAAATSSPAGSATGSAGVVPTTQESLPPAGGGTPRQPGVVGLAGVANWDALPAVERDKPKVGFRSFFLHQSVGGDLEDGAEGEGFKFDYAASGSTDLGAGLNGGLFSARNGNPSGKIAEFQAMALANRGTVRLAIMKFGYADVLDDTVARAQTEYEAAVGVIKAQGIRVLHVTPPLVYNVPADNAPKMQMRTWMLATFPGDVIFDLQGLESTEPGNGMRCERGGSWEICDSVRSTVDCPSQTQGIDAPTGQGHLCYEPHARRFAKAFLYAIYLAGM